MKVNPVISSFTAITIFVVLMIVGLAVMPLLTVKLEPSRTSQTVTVSFSYPKAPAELVENGVTSRLEGVVATVKGVREIRSVSSSGGGYIQLDLDENVNVGQVRYEISMLVRGIYPHLPEGVFYPTVHANRPSSSSDKKAILTYTINGRHSSSAIQKYAEENMLPELSRLEGVQEVNIYGAATNAWELVYDQNTLQLHDVTVNDISASIRTYLQQYELGKAYEVSAGNTGQPGYIYLILQTAGADALAWERIPVKQQGGRIIYLTDLVKVRYAEQKPNSHYRINGLNTVNLEITAARNSNYLLLADGIKEKMAQLEQKLPESYAFLKVYDATDYLKKELTKIAWRTVATIIILLLFVLAATRQLRYLLLIIISLVCNLLVAFIFYYFLQLEIHLYSMAAITVSMGMLIDNSIVMIDHIRHKNNMKVFLAVLGATMTTIGAVSIIFFLEERQQENLLDFAWVMIINLAVSLLVALFLIPALLEKIPLPKPAFASYIRRKRRVAKWNIFYNRVLCQGIRFRRVAFAALLLLFGLPLFLLPNKMEEDSWISGVYNSTLGSKFYISDMRPLVDKWLGGTLGLFLSGSGNFNYRDTSNQKTMLYVNVMMPYGAVLEQMNQVVLGFENYLSQFEEVEQFHSRVHSGLNASIDITFKKEYEEGGFPQMLKSLLESKAVYTGLAEFGIYGLGHGFNNVLNTERANYALNLEGYNYENLYRIAGQVKRMLQESPRVEKVYISSQRINYQGEKPNYEFVFRLDNQEKLLANRLSPGVVNKALIDLSGGKQTIASVFYQGEHVPLVLSSSRPAANVWEVLNQPIQSDSGSYVRLQKFASLEKERIGEQIVRENQQYQLVVSYNFIGDFYLGSKVAERTINTVSANLPLGYSLKEAERNFWGGAEEKLTWAIFLTIGIVFVICAVLLNSLLQPLAVTTMIPVSFIGVFLTSWYFGYRFDEGGYAALVVLCGVVVNAALFILNDYNKLLSKYPHRNKRLLFIKSYNSKIIPIVLSVASTVLGMVPFVILSKGEPFWYALAMSTIGGLLFSMLAIIFVLPLLLQGLKGSSTYNSLK